MAVFEHTEQNLKQKGTKWQKMLPLMVVAVLAVLAAASTLTFYQYMDKTFFKERSSHFIEISDTVTQVIESAVLHYRTAAHTAEAMFEDADTHTESAAKAALAEIQERLGKDNGTVVAFDSSARCYASDGSMGRWQETEMLSNGEEMQTVVTPLDYREDGKSYILVVKKLKIKKKNPIKIGIIGELYTAMEPFSTYELEKKLAKNNIEIKRFTNLSYLLWQKALLKKRMLKKCKKYCRYTLGADGLDNVYRSIYLSKKKYHGIIHTKPFGCTPEIGAIPIIKNVCNDHHMPIIFFSFDTEQEDGGVDTRLEAFFDLLKYRKDKK